MKKRFLFYSILLMGMIGVVLILLSMYVFAFMLSQKQTGVLMMIGFMLAISSLLLMYVYK